MYEKFDIVIPTYNRRVFIERAINSVQSQKHTNWNLFILDNASTDDTEEFVKGLLSEKIHYIRNESNIGLVRNWHKALTHVGNEKYIVLLGDDDELGEEFLVKANEAINLFPKLGMYSSATYINNRGEISKWKCEYFNDIDEDYHISLPGKNLHYFLGGNPISPAAMMVNRESFKSISDSYLHATTSWAFDSYWWAQIALKNTMVFCTTPTATYYQHDQSESVAINKNKFDQLCQQLQVSANILNMASNLELASIDTIKYEIEKLKSQKQLDVLCSLILFGKKELNDFALEYFIENNRLLISNINSKKTKMAYKFLGIKKIAYIRMYINRK
jgi:glycosyltransferase involved in cell wall biosynthesis